jgi:exonuclease SbcC
MQIHRLRLLNFRQHEDTDLGFGPGLTGIIGPNGSGKTTLLEALAWCLYGTRAARGAVATIRRRNAPARARVEVELDFTLGAHRYRVIRTLHGAELYQDGDSAPLANSPTAVSDKLRRILGMTREEFFNTYFTGQKELAIMGAMTAPERAQFLSRVLGYERLRVVQERLKVSRSTLRTRLEDLEPRMANPAGLAQEEAAAAEEGKAALQAEHQTAAARHAALVTLERLRPRWLQLEALQERVRSLEGDLRVADHQVTDARDAFARLDRDLTEALTARHRIEALRPSLARLPVLIEERDRLDGLAQRAARHRELTGQIGELRRGLGTLDEEIRALPSPEAVEAAHTALAAVRVIMNEAGAVVSRLHTELVRDQQDAETQVKQLTELYEELRGQERRLRAAGAEGVCPTCGQPLGARHGEVVEELMRQAEDVRAKGRFFRSRMRELEKEPKALKTARVEWERLRAEETVQTSALARLTEIAQRRQRLEVDSAARGRRLQALEAERVGLMGEYDEQRHQEVRGLLGELEPVQLEVERLRGLAERGERLAAEAAEADASVSAREGRAEVLRQNLTAIGWSDETFREVKAAVDAAEHGRQEAEKDVLRAESRLATARKAAALLAERRAQWERDAAEVRRLQLEIRTNQELDRAFSDLRDRLNDTLRPDLSDLGSRFVRDLTMGRFTEFELDEDFAPTIVEDGEAQTVLSGGEEDVVSLALRLAISQMIADRAGQPLSLLILDEIFGSLDEDRRSAVVDLLRRLADRFPQVILITHVDAVREGFDRVLRLSYDVERGVATVREEGTTGHDAAA